MRRTIIRYLSIALFASAVGVFTAPAIAAANWAAIDQLEEQGKFADIPAKLDVIIQQARQQGANKDWRDALLFKASLGLSANAEETLDTLASAPWPQDQDSQLLLNLHLGAYIQQYIQRNSWQINQREKIDTDKPLTTKQKTMAQLRADAHVAFSKAYRLSLQRNDPISRINTLPTKRATSYFTEGDYPKNVRGTVRDTVTYLWIDALKDSSNWLAKQTVEAYGFNVQGMLNSPYKEAINPTDPSAHPLKVAVKLASDLEQFHRANRQPEAELEAFRVKAEVVAGVRNSQRDLQFVIQALRLKIRQQQNSAANLPWVNKLRLDLVGYLDRIDTPTKHIQRLAEIKPCLSGDKEHRLYKLCEGVAAAITHPVISLTTMKSDGINKRSLELNYKNTEQVYFRAWKLTPEQASAGLNARYEYVKTALNNNDLGQHQWSVALAKTQDYQSHKHFMTPPMTQKGYWMIAASIDESFQDEAARVWSGMSVTSLAADIRNGDERLNVTTYLGESGQIAANVEVELWQHDYNTSLKPKRIAVARSDSSGQVSFKRKQNQLHGLVMKYRDDYLLTGTINPSYHYSQNNQQIKNALIFTDRVIYRPSQKIQWKVVAYHGDGEKGKYQIFPNSGGWVKLVDANGKLVKQVSVKTNRFGSASGEFTADAGRLLGKWRILTSWGGGQWISVEEYKRPTFEAKILPPEQSLRLNYLAKITGNARYYFGDRVSSGNVKWRVKRMPMRSKGRYFQIETVASGESALNVKGEFAFAFKPMAVQLEADPDRPLVYRYEVSVDVTDSGGETRTVSRTFSAAAVNISASIRSDNNFGIAGQPMQFSVKRQDLGGEGLEGAGFWELYRLKQPSQAVMAADLPVRDIKKDQQKYATPGDRIRSRWLSDESFTKRTKYWQLGGKVAQGSLRHDADGLADIKLKAPVPGVYRLRYTTKDQWGQVFHKQQSVVVSNHHQAPVNVPGLLLVEKSSVEVGENVSLLAGSAFAQSPVLLEVFHGNQLLRRSLLRGGIKKQNFPVTQAYRGGLTFVMTMVKDYQLVRQQQYVSVPWTDRNLNVSFSTFRDKLRPGQKETWRVTVKDHKNRPMEAGAVEVLASMFDRSLELLEKHRVLGTAILYPRKNLRSGWMSSLGLGRSSGSSTYPVREYIRPYGASRMRLVSGSGGVGAYRAAPKMMAAKPMMAPRAAPAPASAVAEATAAAGMGDDSALNAPRPDATGTPEDSVGVIGETGAGSNVAGLNGIVARKNFNETAFFKPHLILEKNGSVTFEFEVPESLTQWQVWVSAITRDLRGGSAKAFTRTSKELMVRPYLPRFLRAGDQANIEVLINNSSDKAMSGMMDFDVIDPVTEESIAASFKLNPAPRNFNVAAGQSTRQRYSLIAPKDLGMVTIRAKASAGSGAQSYGDGEQRPLPVLPSRIHLTQSRFAALQGGTQRQLRFNELASNNDRTRINDKLVVTVDGQLFYSALKAVPYLTEYPYECTEQTMNRFLSTSIINSTFAQTPSIKAMAAEFAKRKTKLENWSSIENDPNSKMLLEETPWLNQASGGSDDDTKLLKVLDPTVSAAQARSSLQKLTKAQTSDGGFPWWEGGPASPYMTAYLLQGFARAAEFNVQVPKSTVTRAWQYLYKHYVDEIKPKLVDNDYSRLLIALNYTLSSFPDSSWYSGTFSNAERTLMLNNSMKKWQTLPPLLKAQLALTLHRMGRASQANTVFESVMNSAKSDVDNGVYWPQQSRSWLWYNDRIDTHAFMLRAMMEINPQDARRHGLVQWLMLNKKLNHWKSTRATAESIYALVHYLKREQQLGVDERMVVSVGNLPEQEFVFKANEYNGGKQQMVIKDKDITADMANITLKNDSKPLMFASASWHFSTDIAPTSAQGDFFGVTRRFFKRIKQGTEWTLQPLAEGATLKVGDELEVQLSLRSKHNAEFVHLRAPRGAGFEPMESNSGYRWQNGVGYYQEIRDSGVNYFMDRLPVGQYAFKYRLRATTSGKFRVAPATVQSVYAPEFNAYSRGARLSIQ
ncbi:alpha-2-macroglobulin family protein [Leucothrix pacifica]|uniref:Alpha-2-macroglobulin domain-containing protein n=1 Tax=Leucothrix pacifica TaxID=1247513 RepID=A0A317C1N7_9GAMM|nr:alpha-2-macroglobulin family protein [Leucothrix pacifica]PWQ92279.1 hypothetical protein DKW60_21995 [Leucothrix pacifica]